MLRCAVPVLALLAGILSLSTLTSSTKIPVALRIEVDHGEQVLQFLTNSEDVEADAKQFVQEQGLGDDVVAGLVTKVQEAFLARENKLESLVDPAAKSQNRPEFGQPHVCSDFNHMVGRCTLLDAMVTYIVGGGVPGDYVETGVHVGDSAAAVARQLSMYPGKLRTMYLYDSWQGMPDAIEELDGAKAVRLGEDRWGKEASAEAVRVRMRAFGQEPVIHEGWFNETFSHSPQPDTIALLYIDCDWYDSVLDSLNQFYDRVPVGGVIALDDYGFWEGARRALGDFIKQRDLEMPLFERYGPSIIWWIKGKEFNRQGIGFKEFSRN
ncbi:hypothetical protein TrVE_jg2882 [Triparma verrucosa]|uniref:Uncharacterized protein n=1 Tax=Triparma verrucosa TaxID=1606542 RepID=A0A9W7F4V7_9STRA|nr:hypothetical protein TrVE_jg2882 [Triparma verrucosa]